jgi:hypothetical protein
MARLSRVGEKGSEKDDEKKERKREEVASVCRRPKENTSEK